MNALNGNTKQCAKYFYYSTGNDYNVCASCMIDLRDVHIELVSVIRKHVIITMQLLRPEDTISSFQ